VRDVSNDTRLFLFNGLLKNKSGLYDEAIESLKKAVEFSPKKQAVYFELGSCYINKGEFIKGVEVLKEAFELDKRYGEARNIYALGLLYAGQDKEASAILEENYGTDIIPDPRLLRYYWVKKDFAKATLIAEKIVEQSPNNFESVVQLASIYNETGQKAKAIEQIKRAIEIKPEFKAEGEGYIKQLGQ
jgi:tetratricopeptide (TPR) repeat protein